MKDEGVAQINLVYFGNAEPAYHGIDAIQILEAPIFAEGRLAEPRLPGWVAVSATHERAGACAPRSVGGAAAGPRVGVLDLPLPRRSPLVVRPVAVEAGDSAQWATPEQPDVIHFVSLPG